MTVDARFRAVAFLSFSMLTAQAQPSERPQFEVASVKPTLPPFVASMQGAAHGKVTFVNVTLLDCISRAYSVDRRRITGPDWLEQGTFEIRATAPAGSPDD